MDEIADSELDRALREASDEAAREERPSVVSVATALRARVTGPEDPLGALAAALEYYPVDPADCGAHDAGNAEAKTRGCDGSLGPVVAGAYPLWARSLAYAPRPLVAARLADLLWTAGYGDTPRVWAQRAVDSYLAAVYDQFGHVLEISEGLQRAFVISSQIDDGPRHAAVGAALIGLATRSIESAEPSSGVSLSIIEFLAGRSDPDTSTAVEEALERALDRYRDDPWLLEWALDIKVSLVEPERREELRRTQVEAFVEHARRSDGLLRYAHYQHAIELAARHELPIVDALRSEVDALPLQDSEPEIDLTEVPAEVELPPDPVAEFVTRIVGDDSLSAALDRFGACLPTEAAHPESDDAEMERLSFFGILAVDLLARIRGRYGAVSAAGAWFECELIDATAAPLVAQSIQQYEAGDFDGAAATLEPQLERIVQRIAAAADPIVTELDDAGSSAGDGNEIRHVLAALAGALYEPSRRYLQALLAEPSGAFAHDQVESVTPDAATIQRSALLVHAACHLRLLHPAESTAR